MKCLVVTTYPKRLFTGSILDLHPSYAPHAPGQIMNYYPLHLFDVRWGVWISLIMEDRGSCYSNRTQVCTQTTVKPLKVKVFLSKMT